MKTQVFQENTIVSKAVWDSVSSWGDALHVWTSSTAQYSLKHLERRTEKVLDLQEKKVSSLLIPSSCTLRKLLTRPWRRGLFLSLYKAFLFVFHFVGFWRKFAGFLNGTKTGKEHCSSSTNLLDLLAMSNGKNHVQHVCPLKYSQRTNTNAYEAAKALDNLLIPRYWK